LKQVAIALAAQPEPITVLYATPSGCHGIWSQTQAGYTITQSLTYWDAAGTEYTCDPPVGGVPADFGNQQTQATSCEGVSELPSNVGDFQGSVQAFNFVVNKDSSQTSISQEALYFVYGFGEAGQASPWVDETTVFTRPDFSAAQIIAGEYIGVPATAFRGTLAANNADVVTGLRGLTTTGAKESGIGFISGQTADLNREFIRTLALQSTGQSCGYWPDSGPDATDKINVRDGHYALWASNHFFAKVDGSGAIANPSVKTLVGLFAGSEPPPSGLNVLQIEIKTGNIPQCAMRVRRDSDLGPLASFAPPSPCGCYFESEATGSTSCDECTTDAQCNSAAPKCRYGFCEAY
jgi:hypothetical protein